MTVPPEPTASGFQQMSQDEPDEPNRLAEVVGPFYSGGGIARALRITPDEVAARTEDGSLLACRTSDGVVVYPKFQCTPDGSLLPGLEAILRAFTGVADGWTIGVWLRCPVTGGDEMTAAQWLASGRDVEPVLREARRDAARWAR